MRQFIGGKAVRVVTAIALLPVLFALIYALVDNGADRTTFMIAVIFDGLFIATLLPICVLVLATGALGNEIEDQTLPYLTLKPISRYRIVVEKLGATVTTAIPPVMAGLALSYALVFRTTSTEREHLELFGAIAASAVGGVLAYSALFLLVSLFVQRALLAGVTYALLWESLLGRYLPGLRIVSVRHYTESIFVGVLGEERYRTVMPAGEGLQSPDTVTTSVIVLAALSVLAVILAGWRLKRLNLE
jgi:ABC-2 type transport system permease protein